MKSSGSATIGGQRAGALPRRMGNFFLSLGIMLFSFLLYDLGLFGSVDGPLNPAKIGTTLAQFGISRTHLVGLTAATAFIALYWYWILNTVNRRIGARFTCASQNCTAPARREGVVSRKTGETRVQYVCTEGHKCASANFQKAARGPVGNSVGIFCLIICFVLLFFY